MPVSYTTKVRITPETARRVMDRLCDLLQHLPALGIGLHSIVVNPSGKVSVKLDQALPQAQRDHLGLDEDES